MSLATSDLVLQQQDAVFAGDLVGVSSCNPSVNVSTSSDCVVRPLSSSKSKIFTPSYGTQKVLHISPPVQVAAASSSSTQILQTPPPVQVDAQSASFSAIPVIVCSQDQPSVEVVKNISVKEPLPVSVKPPVQVRSQSSAVPVLESAASLLFTSPLSVTAPAFLPVQQLYPPGKDKYGRPIMTEEAAKMHLDYFEVSDIPAPIIEAAKPDIGDTKKLANWPVHLPDGKIFMDKLLPPLATPFQFNIQYPPAYFIDLHEKVVSKGTYNYAGARVALPHCKIKVENFRSKLTDYDDSGVLQYIQFGFPIGLSQQFELESCAKNHSSALEYFTWVDKFISSEIQEVGITGPLTNPPFPFTKVSPMMTAVKNPCARRPVFDASFGDLSINNNTPEKEYLGDGYQFSFPTVLDLAEQIVKLGPGCLLWKRDLSRWFLQLPVDPGDYDKLGIIWRGLWFMFVSYVWGCRHAGYNGQRVSSAVLHIFKNIGSVKYMEPYNAMVYIDDFAGAETHERAWPAFNDMGDLLLNLGIKESIKKALSPSTKMVFLGVEFDTVMMCMRVGEEKCLSVKATVEKWYRRTTATKEELQSLQGVLMWVSKVVRFSRCFVTRIIAELKSLKFQKQKTNLSMDIKKDLLWWKQFMATFNGVELIIPTTVSCNVLGDATLSGGGAWNEERKEFWSRKFPFQYQSPDYPIHLKEFWTVLVQLKTWGRFWSGKRIAIHCDNASVVDTINFLKPKDSELQKCLREFLYYVTLYKFEPVMVRIPTKENHLADFISRNHNVEDIQKEFLKFGVKQMDPIVINDDKFTFIADW